MNVSLRSVEPADEEFLLGLYATTRADELALTDWTDEQKAAFVRHQFDAQTHHYREHYPTATFDVILVDDEPAGRLYVDRLHVERFNPAQRLYAHRGFESEDAGPVHVLMRWRAPAST